MASYSYTITVTSVPSTSAVFTPVGDGTFTAPLASGTTVGSVVVTPPDWTGVLTVNAPFSMNGTDVIVGPTALAKGTYSVNGSSNP